MSEPSTSSMLKQSLWIVAATMERAGWNEIALPFTQGGFDINGRKFLSPKGFAGDEAGKVTISAQFLYIPKANTWVLRKWYFDIDKATSFYLPEHRVWRKILLFPNDLLFYYGKRLANDETRSKQDKEHWFVDSATNIVSLFVLYDQLAAMLDRRQLFQPMPGKAS